MGTSLFLSHNSIDLEFAREVKRRSEAAGASIYMYEDDAQAGTNISGKLMSALQYADGLVAIVTRTSVTRPAVQQEIGAAIALKKPVIAIIEEGVDASMLTFLQGIEHIRLDLACMEDALLNLQRSIGAFQARRRRELLAAILVVLAIIAVAYVATHD